LAKNVHTAGVRESPATIAFSAALVVMALLTAGAVLGAAAVLGMPAWQDHLRALTDNAWWLHYRDPPAVTAAWRIGAAAAAALISLAAVLRGRAFYRREPSPVIPFLMVFLFSLGLECLRAGTAVLYATDGPDAISVLLTRVIYWGRFVGVLGLLIAGLYCTDLKYRTLPVIAGAVFLVSFAMAAYIPIDRTTFLAQLTWKLGDEQSVWFLNLAIGLLAIFTGAVAAFTRRNRTFVLMAIGIAVLATSREFQFFALQPLPLAAGLVTQGAGVILCLSRWEDGRRSAPRPREG
jgi:hypothetical protein